MTPKMYENKTFEVTHAPNATSLVGKRFSVIGNKEIWCNGDHWPVCHKGQDDYDIPGNFWWWEGNHKRMNTGSTGAIGDLMSFEFDGIVAKIIALESKDW